jgi:hypothetical protein
VSAKSLRRLPRPVRASVIASRWLRRRALSVYWNAIENASRRNTTAATVPAVATVRECAASAPNSRSDWSSAAESPA